MSDSKMRISLKAARVNANLTQEEAAQALGISRDTLRSWEKDPSQVSAKYQARIEAVFGLPIDNIIFFEQS